MTEGKVNKEKNTEQRLLALVRITGMIGVKKHQAQTLDRLKLRRKYSCVVVNGNDVSIKGMLDKIKFFVAYGPIDDKTLELLIDKRGESVLGRKQEKNISGKDAAKKLGEGSSLSDLGLKGFFRLHPPRKGIHSKLQYPKGVLGNNKEAINELIGRML